MPDWLQWLGTEFLDARALGRLLLAALLGAVVGLERERSQKAAGLRTNTLICLGSALVMEVSRALAATSGSTVDPSRMPAQVVSGVGFLGAGAILVARGRVVVGLTTAATIWAVAAIGLAAGAGAFTPAVAATALVVLVLTALSRVESALFEPPPTEFLELELAPEPDAVGRLRESLAAQGLRCRLSELEKEGGGTRVLLEVRGRGGERERLLEALARRPEVRRAAVLAVRPSP